MSSFSYDQTAWSPGIRVRPAVDPQSADVEVADVISGRRFHVAPEALAELILANEVESTSSSGHKALQSVCEPSGESARLVPGWQHWRSRRWHPSDQYYVASRRWQYSDVTDPDGRIRSAALERYLEADGPPAEESRREATRISLGEPASPGPQQIPQLLVARRSGRAYVPKPVPLERLSGLLWYGFSEIRQRRERTTPSDPMSYLDSFGSAWDVYLCVFDVAGIEPGTYRYELTEHKLAEVRPGDHREAMIGVLQGMRSPATAAWTLGLVADFPRYQWRYRHEHALRRLYLESGVIGQELAVLGMSYGLGTLVTPAQKDRAYLELHDLSEDRYAPVCTFTMGWSRGAAGVDFQFEQEQPAEPDPIAS